MTASDFAHTVIELFEELDEWLSKDGFLPTRWERANVRE